MHELALTEEILNAAMEAAHQAGPRAIRQLHLTLSSASHIEPESVRAHFAAISRGTPAEEAELLFQIREVRQVCRNCDQPFVVDSSLLCPVCGAPAVAEPPANELSLDSIDVDMPAS